MKSFTRIDLRSLAFHELIAKKLIEDPKKWTIVYSNLEHQCSGTNAYDEWNRLINLNDKEMILKIMCEKSEDGQRLRSSSPFLGILTDNERLEIFNKFKRSS